MSSKSSHCTGNKKFSDFIYMQLSNQHQQIKICEVSHFLHHFLIGGLQINLFLKQTGIRVTKTARNVYFGNLKFTSK